MKELASEYEGSRFMKGLVRKYEGSLPMKELASEYEGSRSMKGLVRK